MLAALPFLVGASVFSFVNALAWRWPRGLPVAAGRSACPACGTAQAADPGALYAHLGDEGLFVIRQQEKDSAAGKPLNTDRLAEFCHSLGARLDAGGLLARALDALQADAGLQPRLRRISGVLGDELRRGASLADAMDA